MSKKRFFSFVIAAVITGILILLFLPLVNKFNKLFELSVSGFDGYVYFFLCWILSGLVIGIVLFFLGKFNKAKPVIFFVSVLVSYFLLLFYSNKSEFGYEGMEVFLFYVALIFGSMIYLCNQLFLRLSGWK